jgi:hypothetical protein
MFSVKIKSPQLLHGLVQCSTEWNRPIGPVDKFTSSVFRADPVNEIDPLYKIFVQNFPCNQTAFYKGKFSSLYECQVSDMAIVQ